MFKSHFYAMLSRMKYINRWGLMRNTRNENLSEHSLDVAFIAHALAIISKNKLGNTEISPEKVAVAAMFHDTTEIITGDMPTPIKYYNPEIKDAYKQIEKVAEDRLVSMLPDYFKSEISLAYQMDEHTMKLVKAADKLSALIKCIEELNMGNKEFLSAKKSTEKSIKSLKLKEVDIFMDEFLDSFYLTLDEQKLDD